MHIDFGKLADAAAVIHVAVGADHVVGKPRQAFHEAAEIPGAGAGVDEQAAPLTLDHIGVVHVELVDGPDALRDFPDLIRQLFHHGFQTSERVFITMAIILISSM